MLRCLRARVNAQVIPGVFVAGGQHFLASLRAVRSAFGNCGERNIAVFARGFEGYPDSRGGPWITTVFCVVLLDRRSRVVDLPLLRRSRTFRGFRSRPRPDRQQTSTTVGSIRPDGPTLRRLDGGVVHPVYQSCSRTCRPKALQPHDLQHLASPGFLRATNLERPAGVCAAEGTAADVVVGASFRRKGICSTCVIEQGRTPLIPLGTPENRIVCLGSAPSSPWHFPEHSSFMRCKTSRGGAAGRRRRGRARRLLPGPLCAALRSALKRPWSGPHTHPPGRLDGE